MQAQTVWERNSCTYINLSGDEHQLVRWLGFEKAGTFYPVLLEFANLATGNPALGRECGAQGWDCPEREACQKHSEVS